MFRLTFNNKKKEKFYWSFPTRSNYIILHIAKENEMCECNGVLGFFETVFVIK